MATSDWRVLFLRSSEEPHNQTILTFLVSAVYFDMEVAGGETGGMNQVFDDEGKKPAASKKTAMATDVDTEPETFRSVVDGKGGVDDA